MATYKITATRETYYEYEVEANSEEEAYLAAQDMELTEPDMEIYAYDWFPLDIKEVEEIA